MNVFVRLPGGSIERRPLVILDDGEISLGSNYNPVTLTYAGTELLAGWGDDSGNGAVYQTESGREIIVPERYAPAVKRAVWKQAF